MRQLTIAIEDNKPRCNLENKNGPSSFGGWRSSALLESEQLPVLSMPQDTLLLLLQQLFHPSRHHRLMLNPRHLSQFMRPALALPALLPKLLHN